MPDTQQDDDLTSRRKRLIYRANHCGMKENDHLIGLFADARVGDMDAAQLDQFEALLKLPDNDLYNWITGRETAPYGVDCDVLEQIIDFNKTA